MRDISLLAVSIQRMPVLLTTREQWQWQCRPIITTTTFQQSAPEGCNVTVKPCCRAYWKPLRGPPFSNVVCDGMAWRIRIRQPVAKVLRSLLGPGSSSGSLSRASYEALLRSTLNLLLSLILSLRTPGNTP